MAAKNGRRQVVLTCPIVLSGPVPSCQYLSATAKLSIPVRYRQDEGRGCAFTGKGNYLDAKVDRENSFVGEGSIPGHVWKQNSHH